ncbi:hypothetical protein H310_10356 [Aphanomyces invadans]|uniref:MalT-like TPR region domain-containing protein n=1 Tax=Aphanomyces invadans TaxID=157072 RepID=A0A024TSS3_9STRA|nr:hypothetical protein H310_10356 [Aphanomyces invadans]ETV96681.1 hypothetical protein H310_10356 [Aphanomyces invadans]|eukprot:XP_008874944.1 hypothetical protein H310_10356 [Aphanomyces invadans]
MHTMMTTQPQPSRGLTLAYFHRFVNDHGGRQAFDGLTTLDVCMRFVKPATQHANVSLVDLVLSQPEGHQFAKPAEWLISHSWSYKFLDVVEAIDNFCLEHDLSHDTSFWFCMFANNQHAIGDSRGMFKQWLEAFRTALVDTGKLVMVLSPWHHPETLQRSWCVYEVYLSIVLHARFEVALSKSQMDDFLVDVQTTHSIDQMKAQINSKHSIATVATDRDHIFDLISEQVGFVQLDRMVFDVLQTWVFRTLDKQVAMAHSPQARFTWIFTRSVLLLNDLQYEKAEAGFEAAVAIFEQELDESYAPGWEAKLYIGTTKVRQFCAREVWEPIFDSAFPKLEQLLGATNSTTLYMKRRIAGAYYMSNDCTRCLAMMREMLDVKLQLPEDKELFSVMFAYGTTLLQLNKRKQAEAWLVKAHAGLCRHLGATHRDTLLCLGNLAVAYVETGRYSEALPLLAEIYEESARMYGATHEESIKQLMSYAGVLVYLGRCDDAAVHLHACINGFERMSTPMWDLRSKHLLGRMYLTKGDLNQAAASLGSVYTNMFKSFGPQYDTCRLALYEWHFATMELERGYDCLAKVDDFMLKFHATDGAGETWAYGVCHMCCEPFQGDIAFCTTCTPYSTKFCSACVASESFEAVCGHHRGPWKVVKPPMRYLLERKLILLANASRWDDYASIADQYRAYCHQFQVQDPMQVLQARDETTRHRTRSWAVLGALLVIVVLTRRKC